jgi:hypothetical protein
MLVRKVNDDRLVMVTHSPVVGGTKDPAMSLFQAMSASVSGPIPASLDASSALR